MSRNGKNMNDLQNEDSYRPPAINRTRAAIVPNGDAGIGVRLRMRRIMLGLSQTKLGEAIGVTFQQIQKYERGTNRISAGTLHALSQALGVPISFFFDQPAAADEVSDRSTSGSTESQDWSIRH